MRRSFTRAGCASRKPAVNRFSSSDALCLPNVGVVCGTLTLKRARNSTIEKFFADHNVRYKSVVAKRIQAIRSASALTRDAGVIAPYKLIVKALLSQLRATMSAIEQLDEEINRLTDKLPDFKLFRSLPGAGKVFAPRLLALFGEDREHFATAAEAQRMVGVAPVTERSGNKVIDENNAIA